MYDRFLADPDAVSQSWREFFADYQRSSVPTVATAQVTAPAPVAVSAKDAASIDEEATPLRGAAASLDETATGAGAVTWALATVGTLERW